LTSLSASELSREKLYRDQPINQWIMRAGYLAIRASADNFQYFVTSDLHTSTRDSTSLSHNKNTPDRGTWQMKQRFKQQEVPKYQYRDLRGK